MGKKHGSLTRAGKVRKQTPKVDPKERPRKLPVGRESNTERDTLLSSPPPLPLLRRSSRPTNKKSHKTFTHT